MQEVFLKYLTKQPVFNDEDHEKAWFIRVTINMSKSYLRLSWFKKREEMKADMRDGVISETEPVHRRDMATAGKEAAAKSNGGEER